MQLANHAFSVNDFLCYLLPLDKCYHGHEGQRAFSEHDDDQEGGGDAGAGLGDDGDDADRREVDRARQHHQGGPARRARRKVMESEALYMLIEL